MMRIEPGLVSLNNILLNTSRLCPFRWSQKAITLGEVYDVIGSDVTTASLVNDVIGSSF